MNQKLHYCKYTVTPTQGCWKKKKKKKEAKSAFKKDQGVNNDKHLNRAVTSPSVGGARPDWGLIP
jgi:hypothetical protein